MDDCWWLWGWKIKRKPINMEPDNKVIVNEKAIIISQYIALFSAIALFLPLSFLITMKYSLLVSIVIESYISISSIIQRVSIFKITGQRTTSSGNQAVLFGFVMLIGAIITIVVVLRLPAGYFPF
jgi:hypothetical protein